MIDIDGHVIDIECPRCAFVARVFLRQVRVCDVIVCGGCKANVRLEDHRGTVRVAQRQIDDAMAELISAFKGFGS